MLVLTVVMACSVLVMAGVMVVMWQTLREVVAQRDALQEWADDVHGGRPHMVLACGTQPTPLHAGRRVVIHG